MSNKQLFRSANTLMLEPRFCCLIDFQHKLMQFQIKKSYEQKTDIKKQ